MATRRLVGGGGQQVVDEDDEAGEGSGGVGETGRRWMGLTPSRRRRGGKKATPRLNL